jgi:hypothetical protein
MTTEPINVVPSKLYWRIPKTECKKEYLNPTAKLTDQTQSKKTTAEEYLQPWTASKYLFEITILEPNMVHRLNDIKIC